MFETTGTAVNTGYSGNINGYSGTAINTIADNYSGLTLSGNSTINYPNNLGLSTAVTSNSNNMRTRQVKAAVFTIERNDKNEIVSTKFVKELWVEVKNGTSLDLIVAKELKGEFDPETTVVREILTVSF